MLCKRGNYNVRAPTFELWNAVEPCSVTSPRAVVDVSTQIILQYIMQREDYVS